MVQGPSDVRERAIGPTFTRRSWRLGASKHKNNDNGVQTVRRPEPRAPPPPEYCGAWERSIPLAAQFTFHFRDAAGLL